MMESSVTDDMEALQKKLKGPGELKEISKRLLNAGKSCSCRWKNCFNYVNAPPAFVFDIADGSKLLGICILVCPLI